MSTDYRGCIQCSRIAMQCPHKIAEFPDDGTVCPKGYRVERREEREERREEREERREEEGEKNACGSSLLPPSSSTPKGIKTEKRGLTPEKRREMSERAKARWESLSPEEQQAHLEKIRKGKKKNEKPTR